MPIIELQRRVAEIGRIRLGETVPYGQGTRPRALHSFRFTSAKQEAIETVAREYGGDIRDWSAPAGPQFEVITTAKEIDVVLIPAEIGFSQWLELWDGSGCVRRCDGIVEVRGDTTRPCVCDTEPGPRRCRETTRLSVLLPIMSNFGSWRLESHSYYAAGEMRTAIELALGIAARRGDHFAFATLRVEDRVTRRPGEQPHRFTVPVLDVRLDPRALAATPAPAGLPGPSEPTTAGLTATEHLALAGYAEPSPRIDRGSIGPDPHPLTDTDRRPPVVPPRADAPPTREEVAEAVDTFKREFPGTEVIAEIPYDEPSTVVGAKRPTVSGMPTEEVDALPFKRSEQEPPAPATAGPVDDRTRTMRRIFATMRNLWPELDNVDRDERRHVLAVIETAKRETGAAASFQDLTQDELSRVEARLDAVARGAIILRPVPGGYAATMRATGQTVTVTRDDNGKWQHRTDDHPPYETGEEAF